MAATWTFDGPDDKMEYVDRAKRILSITGTRTLGDRSKQYTIPSFRVTPGVVLLDEADRFIDELEAVSAADASWATPDLVDLFPNAAAVLKAKADAMEVARG